MHLTASIYISSSFQVFSGGILFIYLFYSLHIQMQVQTTRDFVQYHISRSYFSDWEKAKK